MSGATIVDFKCAICGESVGYEELYPPGVQRAPGRGGEHPLRRLDRHWHYVSNGDRFGDSELTAEEFAHNVEALAGEHPARFMALYCHGCELLYCYGHWRVKYSDDPPRTVGLCPKGHMRVIDW
jgi:hypothetical protein